MAPRLGYQFTCSICHGAFKDVWDNNAQPINDGRCCELCCMTIVNPTRISAAIKRDAEVAARLKKEAAERKRTKALVRIEMLKAKQSGELQRMPLTGKAALDYIKQGKRK
jgi:hypothetical protein